MKGISIVLTFYNGSRFIKEQIQTLFLQTRQFDELLIFDDCSLLSERTKLQSIVDEFCDERISIFSNEQNLGYSANFIEGIKKAKYETVFLCDQDDLWDVTKIQIMSDIIENKAGISLLCSDIQPFYSSNKAPKWDKKNLKTMKCDGSLEMIDMSFTNFHLQRSGCSMCFRKSFFDQISDFWIDDWGHDDFLWKYAVLHKQCAIIHLPLIQRRIHENNTSELKIRTKDSRIDNIKKQNNQYINLLNNNNLTKNDIDIIQKMVEANKKRINFLTGKNVFSWFAIFAKYKYAYPRKAGVYLDLYLFLFKKYKTK